MIICKESASSIIAHIDSLLAQPEDTVLTHAQLWPLSSAVRDFETVFAAEVATLSMYFVSRKGIFDTSSLIENAEDQFPSNVKQELSDKAIADIREAGRCLAFDLGTASGFHIARAVETVLLDYLKVLCSKELEAMNPSTRNLGNYIKMTRDNKGDDKVCGVLDQFKDLHRNPLMHPEAVLTIDEALMLFGIAQSTIVSLVAQIQKLKNPPGARTLPSPPKKRQLGGTVP